LTGRDQAEPASPGRGAGALKLKVFLASGGMATIAAWKLNEEAANPAYRGFCERLYQSFRLLGMPES
jgi:hypothetical protein